MIFVRRYVLLTYLISLFVSILLSVHLALLKEVLMQSLMVCCLKAVPCWFLPLVTGLLPLSLLLIIYDLLAMVWITTAVSGSRILPSSIFIRQPPGRSTKIWVLSPWPCLLRSNICVVIIP